MLNLTKAADIMRRELFAPLGFSLPNIPARWAPAATPTQEAETVYSGLYSKPIVIEMNNVPNNLDPLRAAATLAHELAHVATQPVFTPEDYDDGHPAKWRAVARAVGLDFVTPSYTIPGPAFVAWYNAHLAGIADA